MKRTSLRLSLAASAFALAIFANLALPDPAASVQCWRCKVVPSTGEIGCAVTTTNGWTQCDGDCVFSGSRC
ncbi:MAG TPA: hypothetical protein VJ725_30200 [Thermoanaerobaculia bacterium]|nr:hypothetical protein [Thermoanaerobaculia bacterium]